MATEEQRLIVVGTLGDQVVTRLREFADTSVIIIDETTPLPRQPRDTITFEMKRRVPLDVLDFQPNLQAHKLYQKQEADRKRATAQRKAAFHTKGKR